MFLASEQPLPAPRVCACQNGGVCREDINGALMCDCPPEFFGRLCDNLIQKARVPGVGSTTLLVIPVVILLLLLVAGALYVFVRKHPL